jgi:uncharacterized membrane protein (UPF0127 family)
MRQLLNKTRILLFLSIVLFIPECNISDDSQKNTRTIEVGNHTIQVEIADTPPEWQLGLSYRDTLQENHGMLFVFPDEDRRIFWMRGCNFDIDIAYIEPNGIISEIITMKKEPLNTSPDSLIRYVSQSIKVKYALEMIGGWFEEHNITAGATINLNP